MSTVEPKELIFIASSRKDLSDFPDQVKGVMGFALRQAQLGGKHLASKPLKGFKGAGVLEIVEDHDGDAFRVVYTVQLGDTIYVLHAFQKKSRQGMATPKNEMDLVKQRLAQATEIHAKRQDNRKGTSK